MAAKVKADVLVWRPSPVTLARLSSKRKFPLIGLSASQSPSPSPWPSS
ncbi:hypothetical protein AWZ03_015053, partial [Drosophila navojoa]